MSKKTPELKKWLVVGEMMISVSVEVEAATAKEAKKLAHQASIMSFCHQCATGQPDEWSTSGELDGLPKITSVEER